MEQTLKKILIVTFLLLLALVSFLFIADKAASPRPIREPCSRLTGKSRPS